MTLTDDQTARIEALEMALAHQERNVEELNRMVTQQWRRIDELTLRVKNLTIQLREADARLSRGEGPEPPPPHY